MTRSAISFPFASNEHARLREVREVVDSERRGDPLLQDIAERAAEMFGTLGYGHVADCRAASSAEVEALILDGFDKRVQLAAQIESANREALRRLDLYRSFLAGVLCGPDRRVAAPGRAPDPDIQA